MYKGKNSGVESRSAADEVGRTFTDSDKLEASRYLPSSVETILCLQLCFETGSSTIAILGCSSLFNLVNQFTA